MRTYLKMICSYLLILTVVGCGNNAIDVEMTTGTMSSMSGKPGSPVSLSYKLPTAPEIGKECPVELTFTIDGPVDDVEITVEGSETVQIIDTERLVLGAQETGSEHQLNVTAIPNEAGLRYLNVFVTSRKGEHELRRSFAVPVTGGGDQSMKTRSVPQQMPDGEDVVVMPAEEKIN